jgi:hypothetical protein
MLEIFGEKIPRLLVEKCLEMSEKITPKTRQVPERLFTSDALVVGEDS